jgi:hypothetical protein
VAAEVRHSVKALTDGRAIIVDYPPRPISTSGITWRMGILTLGAEENSSIQICRFVLEPF